MASRSYRVGEIFLEVIQGIGVALKKRLDDIFWSIIGIGIYAVTAPIWIVQLIILHRRGVI